jgi:uncharacterized protein (TIGR03083 family)
MIVDERQHMADLFAGLDEEQLTRQSLCDAWTMHEVAAHLASFLRFGQLKIYLCMIAYAGDFAPGNQRLATWYARRRPEDLIAQLRRDAAAKTTIPRSGYDPVLTDLVLHDLDVRIPLGIPRDLREDRLSVAFHHLSTVPSAGFAVDKRLQRLRFEATDTGWSSGDGAPVRGPAQSVVMAMSGRAEGFADLDGDGVEILRERLGGETPIPVARRLRKLVRTLVRPSDRRSREAEAPELR